MNIYVFFSVPCRMKWGSFPPTPPRFNFLAFPGWDLPPISVGRTWTEGGVVCLFLPSSNQPTNGTYRRDLAVHFRAKKANWKCVCLCSRNQINLEMHLGWIAPAYDGWDEITPLFKVATKTWANRPQIRLRECMYEWYRKICRAHMCVREKEGENSCLRNANFSSRSAVFNFLECWVFGISFSAPSDL